MKPESNKTEARGGVAVQRMVRCVCGAVMKESGKNPECKIWKCECGKHKATKI